MTIERGMGPMTKTSERKMRATGVTLAVVAVATAAIVGCFGCAPTTPSAPDSSAAEEESVYKTNAEWTTMYPAEGESFAQAKMSKTYDAFYAASTAAFGLEDAPAACASCHSRVMFEKHFNEVGYDILYDNTSEYEDMEWSNCSNCHVGDPGEGEVEGGNLYGAVTSASASELFPEEDMVCGQCHAMFPGQTYMEEANEGIDQYKYGYDPDSMLKAMQEYFSENEITGTDIGAGMVGVPALDPNIDTVLYLTDACTALEMFQDSKHQKAGLTCTDCHMPETTTEEGSEYTWHNMTQSPLENPVALEKCMACHESQGIENTEEMVEFAEGKMSEVSELATQTKTDLDTLYGLLSDAVANGGVDEATLDAAKEAYNRANVYYLFQGGTSSEEVRLGGREAAHNYEYQMELLNKAEGILHEAIDSLQ